MSKAKRFKHSNTVRKYNRRAKNPATTMTLKNDGDIYELLYSIDNERSNNPYRVAYNWMHGYQYAHPKEVLHVKRYSVVRISNGRMITKSNGASVWRKR